MSEVLKTIEAQTPVILTDHYLKEATTRGGNDVVVQGVLSRETLGNLGYDVYQRDLGTQRQREKLFAALADGKPLTPIELGMRGSRLKDGKAGSLVLNDPVYVIDGRQRIGSLVEWLAAHPEDTKSFISATVHLGTDFEWEQARFNALNLGQRPVAPSKIFFNSRDVNPGIAAVYGLSTNDKTFALYRRVSWQQSMSREDLTTGRNLLIVAAHLHSHLVPSRGYTVESLVRSMEVIVRAFGVQFLRDNLRDFFDIVDECWGIRHAQYRGGTLQIRAGFLMSSARLFSDHHDFWSNNNRRLNVSPGDRSRLRALILDQNVARLIEGGSKSRLGLRWQMVQCINKRRKNKIREREDVAAAKYTIDVDIEKKAKSKPEMAAS